MTKVAENIPYVKLVASLVSPPLSLQDRASAPRRSTIAPGAVDVAGRPAVVYRIYGKNGRLLYVGCTIQPRVRLAFQCEVMEWHSRHPITAVLVEWYATWEEAITAEAHAIAQERPVLNRKPGYGRYVVPLVVESRRVELVAA